VATVDRAAKSLGERVRRETERDGERHPVHVPRRSRLRRVAVAVRVHPDDAGATAAVGDSGERPDRHGVVTAEDDRDVPGSLDVGDDVSQVLEDADDLVDVMRPAVHLRELVLVDLTEVLGGPLVAVGDADVPAIANRVTEAREAIAKARVANRRRAHVHAAAVPAEIHRHADDLDRPAHGAFAFGWKMARIVPSAASSSPIIVRTATRANPRRIFSNVASKRAVSPGLTMRLKRISSMPAKRPSPSRYSGSAMAITVAAWASDSTRITPGTIGLPGKWPFRYHSSPVKVCSATARTPGSSPVTRSMRTNGSRCG